MSVFLLNVCERRIDVGCRFDIFVILTLHVVLTLDVILTLDVVLALDVILTLDVVLTLDVILAFCGAYESQRTKYIKSLMDKSLKLRVKPSESLNLLFFQKANGHS